jgi:hypothetical protein
VAVQWRTPEEVAVELPPVMKRRGIGFSSVDAERDAAQGQKHPAPQGSPERRWR